LFGFASGAYLSGRQRSLQFLAENAHRLPKTVKGWYFYHKYKQHEAIHGAYKGGLRYALRFGFVGLMYCGTEALMESEKFGLIGTESWMCSLGAGLVTANIFSLTGESPKQNKTKQKN
jgi:Na+(H+)/acetate symporter ActP